MSDADNERRSRRACRPWRWAIAQIPFETVRNWMSNDRAFRPEFFRAFDRAKAIAARKRIKMLSDSKDWRADAFWLERYVPEFARKKVTPEVGEANQQHRSDGIIITPELMKELSEAHDGLMEKLKKANGNGGK